MQYKYITCSDCQTEWKERCGLCKKKAWQIKKEKKRKDPNKKKAAIEWRKKKLQEAIQSEIERVKKHYSTKAERKYWSKIHPKRVVQLIMRGHDPACACCFAIDNLTFDHIIPLSKGGSNALTNGQILCHDCNNLKGDKIMSIEFMQRHFFVKEEIQGSTFLEIR